MPRRVPSFPVYKFVIADFMNQENLLYILKKTISSKSYKWDLLGDTRNTVVAHIVEDEDQEPTKEWGPYGWYCCPSGEDISKVSDGKTVIYLL
jgi:hypothetical protein